MYDDIFGQIIDQLTDENGIFVEEECLFFDYKADFPFSRSDDYFGGILRLICALHNTHGGVIVFGVHDTLRTGGHNKVIINIESFNAVLADRLSSRVECFYKKQEDGQGATIDLLLVPKRLAGMKPVVANKDFGTYKAGIYWYRPNHEVREINSRNLPFIFSERTYSTQHVDEYTGIEDASLPPSPSTLPSFVGRIELLGDLWEWLFVDRTVKKFLHGSGGSGKSTLAYEFASLIVENAKNITSKKGDKLDQVIWLSAKKKSLDTGSNKIVSNSNDFDDAKSLYEAILICSNLIEEDKYQHADIDVLLELLEKVFSVANILLIIDDIDTLITAGVDTGLDGLEQAIYLSRSFCKVLYTQRNLPSHSRGNAIEVPGFTLGEEYYDFLHKSCEYFKVPRPDDDYTQSIHELASGRPLIIEVIVGLRRRFPSYRDAIRAFEELPAGQEALVYMYDREYNFLEFQNSKNLLAALYLWERPVSFTELQVTLMLDENEISSIIGEVNEIFLSHHHSNEDETLYALNTVASHYVSKKCQQLPMYSRIKQRIQNTKGGQLPRLPEIEKLVHRVKYLLSNGEEDIASSVVFSESYDAKVLEHPDFLALQGKVAMSQQKPDLQLVRSCLEKASNINKISIGLFWEWLNFEELNEDANEYCQTICDRVIEGKGYRLSEKADFCAKKAQLLCKRALSYKSYSYAKEREAYVFSIKENLKGVNLTAKSRRPDLLRHHKYVKTSVYYLYNCAVENNDFGNFIKTLTEFIKDRYQCDAFSDFFKDNQRLILRDRMEFHNETIGMLQGLKTNVAKHTVSFNQETSNKNFVTVLERIIEELKSNAA
ncbi:RNA-binding domain-containing protein [Kordiimonas sediminis]|nr:RNA-binding domain-containing protein [Kordiimonas sediminis]